MPHKEPEARRAYQKAYREKNRDRQRERMRNWQRENKEKSKEYKQRWHAKRWEEDPDGMRAKNRAAWLMHRYGLTVEDHDRLLEAHENRCAICRTEAIPGKPLHVDHNHRSGTIRGLLCACCNWAVGCLQDDPELMKKAADYISRQEAEENERNQSSSR